MNGDVIFVFLVLAWLLFLLGGNLFLRGMILWSSMLAFVALMDYYS